MRTGKNLQSLETAEKQYDRHWTGLKGEETEEQKYEVGLEISDEGTGDSESSETCCDATDTADDVTSTSGMVY
jgi:hypothetical protein